jgi:hypothetical protein
MSHGRVLRVSWCFSSLDIHLGGPLPSIVAIHTRVHTLLSQNLTSPVVVGVRRYKPKRQYSINKANNPLIDADRAFTQLTYRKR